MENKKYPIGGYAPGNYHCNCCKCGSFFHGDKRAVECEPCAMAAKEKFDALPQEEQAEVMKRNIEEVNKAFKDWTEKPTVNLAIMGHGKPAVYYPSAEYQNLFDYLQHEHRLSLLQSEMSDLIDMVHKFYPKGNHLTPGAPTTTGTYFAVLKRFAGGGDEMVVIHYQADKGVYYAYGTMSRPVKAEDVIGHVARDAHEDITRADYERKQAGMRWVRVSDKLPNPDQRVMLYDDGLLLAVFKYWPADFKENDEPCFIGMNDKGPYGLDEVTHWAPLPPGPDESAIPEAGREEDACDFAEWMRLNCVSSQHGWVDALGKWDTTKGWYELFKQHNP